LDLFVPKIRIKIRIQGDQNVFHNGKVGKLYDSKIWMFSLKGWRLLPELG
jgi:hypothetical protein